MESWWNIYGYVTKMNEGSFSEITEISYLSMNKSSKRFQTVYENEKQQLCKKNFHQRNTEENMTEEWILKLCTVNNES